MRNRPKGSHGAPVTTAARNNLICLNINDDAQLPKQFFLRSASS